ncbi:MAG TPA: TetR/AcrR family transcriptional regulator [Acidimicrobiales bacterium]|nr:TetR/AcrR family transcriptional regulator [Acidimicrobiales bacterium]
MTQTSSDALTGPEAIRAARASWRRSQIVEAAVRLMEEQGFHQMSVSSLAREAGISVGTIYQYLDSKEDILLLILEDVLRTYAREVPQSMAGLTDPLERLAAGFLAYCRVVDTHQAATLLAYRESRSLSRSGLQTVIGLEVQTTGLLVAELGAALRAGIVRPHDTELVGWDLMMLAHMWALKHWHFSAHQDVAAYGRAQLALLLDGLVVERERERYARLLLLPERRAAALAATAAPGASGAAGDGATGRP